MECHIAMHGAPKQNKKHLLVLKIYHNKKNIYQALLNNNLQSR
jgi:hypothetical protein